MHPVLVFWDGWVAVVANLRLRLQTLVCFAEGWSVCQILNFVSKKEICCEQRLDIFLVQSQLRLCLVSVSECGVPVCLQDRSQ